MIGCPRVQYQPDLYVDIGVTVIDTHLAKNLLVLAKEEWLKAFLRVSSSSCSLTYFSWYRSNGCIRGREGEGSWGCSLPVLHYHQMWLPRLTSHKSCVCHGYPSRSLLCVGVSCNLYKINVLLGRCWGHPSHISACLPFDLLKLVVLGALSLILQQT